MALRVAELHAPLAQLQSDMLAIHRRWHHRAGRALIARMGGVGDGLRAARKAIIASARTAQYERTPPAGQVGRWAWALVVFCLRAETVLLGAKDRRFSACWCRSWERSSGRRGRPPRHLATTRSSAEHGFCHHTCRHPAGGRFAPGHVRELTRVVPFEMVDAVLTETGTLQQRVRALPLRVVVYLLLARLRTDSGGLQLPVNAYCLRVRRAAPHTEVGA